MLENPEPNVVYSYKSIGTGHIWFKLPKSCLKSELSSVWISVIRYSDIHCTYIFFQEWTMSSALGHVRNFIANHHGREEGESRLERYIIQRGSEEDGQRKRERRNRNTIK